MKKLAYLKCILTPQLAEKVLDAFLRSYPTLYKIQSRDCIHAVMWDETDYATFEKMIASRKKIQDVLVKKRTTLSSKKSHIYFDEETNKSVTFMKVVPTVVDRTLLLEGGVIQKVPYITATIDCILRPSAKAMGEIMYLLPELRGYIIAGPYWELEEDVGHYVQKKSMTDLHVESWQDYLQ